ncbi:ATP-binding protein [Sphingomonas cavernae]|uniref:ATP-binding protein n=1 Tax=Sphingomonas cavernae TaxID=2320861 RepID=A0A418WSJ7_9SPHN|nr:ATP-binding protein [Sphingomonas cavernae]RJF94228.1 ATP-binding protein [Sphingomonas cavernae]
MNGNANDIARIAAALERLSPPPPESADPATHPAYVWRGGVLAAARAFEPLPFDILSGIDAQKAAVIQNGRRLAAGHSAHDVLLWGARGMGKSALVKSMVGALHAEHADIALVEIPGDALAELPALFAQIAAAQRAFVLFIDDLGFDDNGGEARTLRSLLEGGAEARPANARLHVTSNRRHIVPRAMEEQQSAINPRDVVDDRMALSDRFGLSLGFHNCDQDTYLGIVETYARLNGFAFDPADALLWATTRGSRSGRVAWHYAVELAGRAGKHI